MRHGYRLIKSFVCLLLLLTAIGASAQNRIENIRVTEPVERADGQVVVRIIYDLISDDPESTFNIEVFTSMDTYTFPLEYVTGEGAGPGTKPGKDLVIDWYPVKEQGTVNQEVTFEIRARLEVPVIDPAVAAAAAVAGLSFKRPESGAKFRPGTTESLQWEGGVPEDNFKLELIRNSVKQKDIGTTTNTGNYTWKIPQDVKGKGFQIKLTDETNPSRSVLSGRFKVGKTSFLVYALPIAIAGGAAAYFLTREGDPCADDPTSYGCQPVLTVSPPSNPQ